MKEGEREGAREAKKEGLQTAETERQREGNLIVQYGSTPKG